MRLKFLPETIAKPFFQFNILLVALFYSFSPGHHAQAQRIAPIFFNKLPQDLQLYPRNDQSEGIIPISGIVEAAGYSYLSVQILRNNAPHQYVRSEIKYNEKGIGSFAVETKIKAELADYGFKVYLCKSGDSTLIVERMNVVSGDVYIVSGQSNSIGFFTDSDTSRYCRTFGKITGTLNTELYNPADTLWAFSNQHVYNTSVGTMGLAIQKQLVQHSGVPNCLINAGFHWSSAQGHSVRNENNPADLNTGYGRMLYRLQKSGLVNAARSYIFRQGETEAYHEGGNWPFYFDKLRTNLKTDLPNLEKIYVFQIDVIYYVSPTGAEIRDYQRRLPDIYPDLRSLATVGTQGFDGLHYSKQGNQQGGFELSRLIARDFYGLTDTANISSPNIQKIFYKTPEKKEVVLVFDEGQELVYPQPYKVNDNLTLEMKDFFYFNGEAGSVTTGKAEENRIMLELRAPQQATTMDLMPMFTAMGSPYYPLEGPFIKNKLGMRAFTFFKVPIETALSTPKLTLTQQTEGNVKLTWGKVPSASAYILERKLSDEIRFNQLARLDSLTLNFVDKNPPVSGKIAYRLNAVSKTSESADYAFAETSPDVVTGVEQEADQLFTVFPNPVQKGQLMKVQLKKLLNGTLSLVNSNGRPVQSQQILHEKEVEIAIPEDGAGYYFIRLQAGEQHSATKVLIR